MDFSPFVCSTEKVRFLQFFRYSICSSLNALVYLFRAIRSKPKANHQFSLHHSQNSYLYKVRKWWIIIFPKLFEPYTIWFQVWRSTLHTHKKIAVASVTVWCSILTLASCSLRLHFAFCAHESFRKKSVSIDLK